MNNYNPCLEIYCHFEDGKCIVCGHIIEDQEPFEIPEENVKQQNSPP